MNQSVANVEHDNDDDLKITIYKPTKEPKAQKPNVTHNLFAPKTPRNGQQE